MTASEILSEVVPNIHKDDKASAALNWMDVFKVSHLPIIADNKYLGLISDNDIYDMNDPEKPVFEHCLSLRRPFVFHDQHIFEVIDLVSTHRLTTIPVLDAEENYLGLITITDLAQELSFLLSTENPGGIIILELNNNDYSLSEIAQIVESNNAKILSLYTHSLQKTEKTLVTIKLNFTDISSVIKTFERYSYKIKNTYSSNKELDTMMQDRLDSFFNYLNI